MGFWWLYNMFGIITDTSTFVTRLFVIRQSQADEGGIRGPFCDGIDAESRLRRVQHDNCGF